MLEPYPENLLLRALPGDLLNRLLPMAEVVEPRARQVVAEPESPITHLQFPVGGTITLLTVLDGGESIEAGLVGQGGVLGAGALLGEGDNPWRSVVLVPGRLLRVRAEDILADSELTAAMIIPMARHIASALRVSTVAIACSRFHTVRQRTARWLLVAHDQVQGARPVPLTHSFLSEILGVRRQSVTEAFAAFERAEMLRRAGPGRVEVQDRAQLESVACECYARIKAIQSQSVGEARVR